MIFTRDIWSDHNLTRSITIQDVEDALDELIVVETSEEKQEKLTEKMEKFSTCEAKENIQQNECQTIVSKQKSKRTKWMSEPNRLNVKSGGQCIRGLDYNANNICAYVDDNKSLFIFPNERPICTEVKAVLKFCPNPIYNLLVVAGCNKEIIFVDLISMTETDRFPVDYDVCSISFSPDGNQFLLGMSEGYVTIYNIEGVRQYKSKLHEKVVEAVCFSKNHFVTASQDGCSKIFSLVSLPYQEICSWNCRKLKSKDRFVVSAKFSSDGDYCAFGDNFGKMKIYDVPAEKLSPQLNVLKGSENVNIFSFDNSSILVYSGRTIYIFDRKTGKQLNYKNNSFDIHAMALSPNGTHLLCGGGTIKGMINEFTLNNSNTLRK
eukprot:TRINITY_DN3311_c2_g1_i6.p1 TRINITY_DN3311_c2_g1~~TRINITY_DN3311_c2_g1_i6.p1  ORF type:complete len:377 (+),score=57.84 TRINITY_DN3311_c2_g1_i6:530-1660(+)